MDGNRKGYKKVISEESGSTEQGRKTVVATYRPSRGLSKVVERDIEYRTATSPRNRSTIKETTKRYNDGSVKSYKNIVKQNGSIVPEVTTPKVKYRKGEKPFGKKIGANMKGDPIKDKDLRNKLLRIKGSNQLDIYDLEKKEYVKKTGYLPPSSVKNITEMKLSNEVTKNKPNSYSEMNSYSKRKEVLKPPTTRSMGMERTTYSVIGNINDGAKNPVSRNDFYIPGAKNSIGYKEFAKNKNIVREVENKIKGANMKGVPHRGPSMQGSWMRKHVKG